MIPVFDVAGVQIEPGDTVVYSTATRYVRSLPVVTVINVSAEEEEYQVYNPDYDYNNPGAAPLLIDGKRQIVKIQIQESGTEYTDQFGDTQIKPGKKRTLDNPKRFAVIKKG